MGTASQNLGAIGHTAFYADSALGNNNAAFHNSLYRGKYLGTSVTADQYAQISAGTFDDLFIGDYWTINDVNWRIAAFDYWLGTGDTACATHHIVIVPDTNLVSTKMHHENKTDGAYVGSDYYTGANSITGKANANTIINNAFGSSHILSHREYLKNSCMKNSSNAGYETAGSWYDSTFELMTEQMVYGGQVFTNCLNQADIPAGYTIDQAQLPLFAHDHSRICNRAHWWLRSVVSSALFALVFSHGYCTYADASASIGVRPAFAIRA